MDKPSHRHGNRAWALDSHVCVYGVGCMCGVWCGVCVCGVWVLLILREGCGRLFREMFTSVLGQGCNISCSQTGSGFEPHAPVALPPDGSWSPVTEGASTLGVTGFLPCDPICP